MTPFIASATTRGREFAARLFNAATQEDLRGLIAQMTAASGFGPDGHLRLPAPADEFIFHIAVAQRDGAVPERLRVSSYDAAGLVAMNARAYLEALYAFERAQELARCRDRQKRIEDIRRLLVARGELAPPPTAPAARSKPARSSRAPRSTRGR